MHCPKAGSVVFLGLVLMTAGFVLTLVGWFAPPNGEAVLRVRLAGPVSLLVGLFLLGVSCCVCAVQQRKCCVCCNPEKEPLEGRYDHTQLSPLLLREMRLAMDRVGASSTANSSAAPSAVCSSSSLPQQEVVNSRQGSVGSIGASIRNHHSPRRKKQRRGNLSPNPNSFSGGQSEGTCSSCRTKSSHGGSVPGRSAPRPASVFLPRTALYDETYSLPGARSPTNIDLYQKQVKVALQPYTVGTDNCVIPARSPSPSSSHRARALTPTIYLNSYAEDIVSAL